MKSLLFSTGNSQKFQAAKHTCNTYGIRVTQQAADVPEIQSEDPEVVARDKARKAYTLLGQPVVITDDAWAFMGLQGFPGVYMHSINTWFTPEDFLRLTLPLTDRRVVLMQCLVYDDGQSQKVCTRQVKGTLLTKIRGTSIHPSHTIITLAGDDGLSIAEAYDQTTDKSNHKAAQIWHDFAAWFIAQP